jgi:hypothetical protein
MAHTVMKKSERCSCPCMMIMSAMRLASAASGKPSWYLGQVLQKERAGWGDALHDEVEMRLVNARQQEGKVHGLEVEGHEPHLHKL